MTRRRRRDYLLGGAGGSVVRSAEMDSGTGLIYPVAGGEWDSTNASGVGTGGGVSYDSSLFYTGSGSIKYVAAADASGGCICRSNFFSPPGSTIETNTIAQKGNTLWMGGRFYWGATPVTHTWTQFLRLTNFPGQWSNISTIVSSNTIIVRVEDYGGTPTGIGDYGLLTGPTLTRSVWKGVEVGAYLSDVAAECWAELWIDNLLYQRVTGTATMKLANNLFKRNQFGLCDYQGDTDGATQLNVDHGYYGNYRRGV